MNVQSDVLSNMLLSLSENSNISCPLTWIIPVSHQKKDSSLYPLLILGLIPHPVSFLNPVSREIFFKNLLSFIPCRGPHSSTETFMWLNYVGSLLLFLDLTLLHTLAGRNFRGQKLSWAETFAGRNLLVFCDFDPFSRKLKPGKI